MNERVFEVEIRDKAAEEAQARIEKRERQRKKDRRRALIERVALVFLLAVLVIVLLFRITAKSRAGATEETQAPADTGEIITSMAIIDPDMGLLDPGAMNTPAEIEQPTTEVAEDPIDSQRITDAIVEILLAQGYLSDAVPLAYEYQDYMRFFAAAYGCPYPLALATADYETRGTFDMDAVGAVGEVGIFQLNPGPGGTYHADLEENTGLDPNTPMGNIAGGCYLLGKYMDAYGGDVDKVAMAYNMGPSGAARAWEAGITSTEYSRGFKEAVEKWESLVNAWRGI